MFVVLPHVESLSRKGNVLLILWRKLGGPLLPAERGRVQHFPLGILAVEVAWFAVEVLIAKLGLVALAVTFYGDPGASNTGSRLRPRYEPARFS